MATITVRRPDFQWPADLPVLPISDDPSRSCELVALSFTLPYLEPYLIRTMRLAAKEVTDPELQSEIKAFSGQEAQHFQNHARINEVVRAKLRPENAAAMQTLETALEADYRRFSDEKSLAFNLAYAEGFEAMTFALARSAMRVADAGVMDSDWGNLFAWHLSEEIEHRTVTFDAYEHIVGRYRYRVAVGSLAQAHFLRVLLRMATVLQRETIGPKARMWRTVGQAVGRNWRNGALPATLRATLPGYNPRRIALSDEVKMIAASQGIELV